MRIPRFPLEWPAGWARTGHFDRAHAKFNTAERNRRPDGSPGWLQRKSITIADGTARVMESLGRMGVAEDDVVISSNLKTRLDGLPRSGQGEPKDPGVAVYWLEPFGRQREPRCIAVDRYLRCADNLAAVAATLEAMRAIERHGGAEILTRAFVGFAALPAPRGTPWWEILGVPRDATHDVVHAAYLRLRGAHHPDKGGSVDEFNATQHAWDAYELERAAR